MPGFQQVRCVSLAAVAAALLACAAMAQEPDVSFQRKKLKSSALETVWYSFKPGDQAVIDYVAPVLARHGVARDKDYFLDRDDALGILAITGKPEAVAAVLEALTSFNTGKPQVKVTVQIAETLTSSDTQTGIDFKWDRKTSERTFFQGFSTDNRPQAYLDNLLSSVPFQGSTAEFGTVDSKGNILDTEQYNRVGAVYMAVRAVKELQNTEILAQPAILVSSGVAAEIFSGSSYPYQQVTFSGSTAIISTKLIPIGVTMKVTPFVVGKSKIRTKVDVTVENVVGFIEIAQGVKNPYTDKRQIVDSLMLDSGTTLSIGGLYQYEQALVEKGVPVLMDIPIIGLLFKSYWNQAKKKELLFFITPKIVEPSERFNVPIRPESERSTGRGGRR